VQFYFSTNPADLQLACTAAVEAFTKSPICSEVYNVIIRHLKQVFGDEYDTVRLAVRSSASGITSAEHFTTLL